MRSWEDVPSSEVEAEISRRVEEMTRRNELGLPLRDESEEYLNHHDPQDYVRPADIEVKFVGASEITNYTRQRKRKKGG